MLLQAGFMLAVFIGARKAQKKIMALADDVRLHALPVIMSSREVIQDIDPKLKTITDNLEVTSTVLRSKSEQVGGLVGDVTNRAQAQAARWMVWSRAPSTRSPLLFTRLKRELPRPSAR